MAITYRDAGVDVEAGSRLVDQIKPHLERTRREELLDNPGGFAALATIPAKYRNPVLVTGTDGVGTKLELLINHGRHRLVGQDLVAMCVNDILVYGAEPFLFLDYFACDSLDVEVAAAVVEGIAEACEYAGCTLAGGETAEMPGFYPPEKYDLAGFCIGFVERDAILAPENVREGDVIVGVRSSGPHSNGYSLIRRIMSQHEPHPQTVLRQILTPTRIYSKSLLPIVSLLHGMAHITGGGFKDNTPRSFSSDLQAELDLSSWDRQECFAWLQENGPIDDHEMLSTFNCGLGMLLFAPENNVSTILEALNRTGESAICVGRIRKRTVAAKSGNLVVSQDDYRIA